MAQHDFDEWIGKTESCQDQVTIAPLAAMAATLDDPDQQFGPGSEVPPLWHWLYFLNPSAQSKLAEDGHPRKGEFLPPIKLPRRMWAGSRLTFHQPLTVGQSIERLSTIKNIAFKQGRSGKLGFVTVGHNISAGPQSCIEEEHDIVYRDRPSGDSPLPAGVSAPEHADYSRTVTPDPVLLFRYSALTFNGHRIHYDREFTRDSEGYPGLVVHGPLLATLLLHLLTGTFPGARIGSFQFQARRPVFDLHAFQVCGLDPDQGGQARVWIKDHNNMLCMEAVATIL